MSVCIVNKICPQTVAKLYSCVAEIRIKAVFDVKFDLADWY